MTEGKLVLSNELNSFSLRAIVGCVSYYIQNETALGFRSVSDSNSKNIENKNSEDILEKISSVSEAYNADIIIYSGGITELGFGKLIEEILRNRKRDNILFILVTDGGSANAGYKIARFLQRVYKRFYLFAPKNCYSAGTLIALGAHELIMGPFSELGPLDVQLWKQNELGERKSGLLSRSSFSALENSAFELFENFMLNIKRKSGNLVSFRVAADVAAHVAGSLMSGVYAKIDPDAVGSDQRDLEVALHYGLRLAHKSGNADLSTVNHLINHYPSHDFVIDDEEASEMFQNVTFPDEDLMLIFALWESTISDDDAISVVFVSRAPPKKEEVEDDEDGSLKNGRPLAEAGSGELGESGHPNGARNTEGRGAARAGKRADDGSKTSGG